MNGTPERRIEIFAPFNEALELTKRILFQPFDLTKWLVIGFAAFLAHLAGGGGGGNFNYRTSAPWKGNWNWNYRSWSGGDVYQTHDFSGCWIPLIIGLGCLTIVVVLVCLWVGSRGKFIFTDCIVRNRAAIVEPWHEFRREGNSLFLFHLLVGLAMLIVLALASIPIWIPLALHGVAPHGPAFILALIGFGCVFFAAAVFLSVASAFMVPLMYRRRCSALEAFQAAVGMIGEEPGPVILYVLFMIVLWVAFGMIVCLTTCVTCCITAIPYVGTVILLPGYVFLASYLLLFVRQFGPTYDAWGNLPVPATTPTDIPPAAPLTTPTEPPPSTEPPPPPPVQT